MICNSLVLGHSEICYCVHRAELLSHVRMARNQVFTSTNYCYNTHFNIISRAIRFSYVCLAAKSNFIHFSCVLHVLPHSTLLISFNLTVLGTPCLWVCIARRFGGPHFFLFKGQTVRQHRCEHLESYSVMYLKLRFCFKYRVVKAYGGVDVETHAFFNVGIRLR
jgi:hypothetical protein